MPPLVHVHVVKHGLVRYLGSNTSDHAYQWSASSRTTNYGLNQGKQAM